jgi:hypothetical protein
LSRGFVVFAGVFEGGLAKVSANNTVFCGHKTVNKRKNAVLRWVVLRAEKFALVSTIFSIFSTERKAALLGRPFF